jgi:hypothetical protein
VNLRAESLLAAASAQWEIFHVIVGEGSHATRHPDRVRSKWSALLGQRALWLSDYRRMAEVIVTAIQLAKGADYDDVVGSWDAESGPAVTTAFGRGIALGGVVAR